MSELKSISLSSIDENPHRNLCTYPWIESKVEALQRSIEAVGLWEGVIVRKAGRRYQAAFGHHRLEAARRQGLTKVAVIVRDLSDQQMLEFMGRENGEDYSTEFLVMLNTWEGAVSFLGASSKDTDRISVATILGWTRDDRGKQGINNVGDTCSQAAELISGGHIDRADLDGLSVFQAREIVAVTRKRIAQIAKAAKKFGKDEATTKAAQATVAEAAKRTAKKAKDGKVATKSIRGDVTDEAFRGAAQSKPKKQLLFAAFGDSLANQIAKTISADSMCDKLEDIQDALSIIEFDDDKRVVDRIRYELGELEGRAKNWQKRMKVSKTVEKRVVPFKAIEGGKA